MYIRNSMGPRTDPSGMPHEIFCGSDAVLLITTVCCQL